MPPLYCGPMRFPPWLQATALIVAGAAAYSNVSSAPFVFDDDPALVHNATIRHIGWDTLAPPADTTLGGRPLANLSFALNYAISGLRLAPLHWTNVAIHLVAALLLMSLLRRLWREDAIA